MGSVVNMLEVGVEGLFYVLLLCFTLHALFSGYHWFTYGTSRRLSLTALALYLGGGAALFLTFSVAMSAL